MAAYITCIAKWAAVIPAIFLLSNSPPIVDRYSIVPWKPSLAAYSIAVFPLPLLQFTEPPCVGFADVGYHYHGTFYDYGSKIYLINKYSYYMVKSTVGGCCYVVIIIGLIYVYGCMYLDV